jgi:hypothetical protein
MNMVKQKKTVIRRSSKIPDSIVDTRPKVRARRAQW